ncbi:MAG: ABC transporter substrate-binding protein, partial [Gammaproteobacteria bacterium]
TAKGLLAGRVDVSWGGPMRVMLHRDADPGCPLVCFCEVVARDPFYLVGREPNTRFDFHDLEGLRVGVPVEVPTPWMTFQDDLRRAGVNPGGLNRIADRSMRELASDLRRGELDVVQLMEPQVDSLLQDGSGHLWHAFAARGDIGFTSFYTTRAFMDARPQVCRRLTRVMSRALESVYTLEPGEIATLIASCFPALDHAHLARGIERYVSAGLWARHTALSKTAFERLKAALLSGGLISTDVPYEQTVENRFCEGGP